MLPPTVARSTRQQMKGKRLLITLVPTLREALLPKLRAVIDGFHADGCEVRLLTLYRQDATLDPLMLRSWGASHRLGLFTWLRVLFGFRWLLWTQRMRVWSKVGLPAAFVKVVKEFRRSGRILATADPDVVYVWNPYCCAFGILGEVARLSGRQVRTIEYGVLPDTLLLDRGFIFDSELFAGHAEVRGRHLEEGRAVLEMLQRAGAARLYAQASAHVPAGAELLPGDIGILVLGLSEVDAGVVPSWGGERRGPYPYHANGVELARAIAACSPTYKVIYKPHPNHNPLHEDVRLMDNAWVVNGDAHGLLDWCHVVVANGSKMEIDAMVAGKPVVNVGTGILSYSEASYRMSAWDQLETTILQAHQREGFEQRRIALADFLGYLSKKLI